MAPNTEPREGRWHFAGSASTPVAVSATPRITAVFLRELPEHINQGQSPSNLGQHPYRHGKREDISITSTKREHYSLDGP